jgi:mRNA interferase RelE/StbE
MQTRFLKKFSKDLDKFTQPKDKKAILQIIQNVKECNSLDDIPNVKKLTGYANAFRIRSGNLRVGVFVDEQKTVEFARIAFRKDIYNIFP